MTAVVYIHDLLVHKDFRGKSFGKKLIESAVNHFDSNTIYVMSEACEYYFK